MRGRKLPRFFVRVVLYGKGRALKGGLNFFHLFKAAFLGHYILHIRKKLQKNLSNIKKTIEFFFFMVYNMGVVVKSG